MSNIFVIQVHCVHVHRLDFKEYIHVYNQTLHFYNICFLFFFFKNKSFYFYCPKHIVYLQNSYSMLNIKLNYNTCRMYVFLFKFLFQFYVKTCFSLKNTWLNYRKSVLFKVGTDLQKNGFVLWLKWFKNRFDVFLRLNCTFNKKCRILYLNT